MTVDALKNGNLPKAKKGITATKALTNLVKAMVGPGCLSLPLAYKQSGLWAGFVLMIALGVVTYISYRKIVKCSHVLKSRKDLPPLHYGSLAEESFKVSFKRVARFGRLARFTVNFFLFVMQIGILSVYVVFIKEHVKEFISVEWSSLNVEEWEIITLEIIFLILLCSIKNIHAISHISMLGNVFMITVLLIVFQLLIRSDHLWSELPAVNGLSGVALAAGSIMYSFEGQTMILPMENKMENPKQMMGFFGVLSMGCFIVTIIYQLCGVLGYITYGSAVKGSITLNLPETPLFVAAKLLMVLVVCSSYLIQHFVAVDLVWPSLEKALNRRKALVGRWKKIAYWSCTTSIVFVSLIVAVAVPDLENIIPLVGVTAGMMLALILPPIIESALMLPIWISDGKYLEMFLQMFSNIIFFSVGIIFLVQGLYTNFGNILRISPQN